MILRITSKPVYSILKNGKRGKEIAHEISREIIYSPEDFDEYGNVKPVRSSFTREQRADIFFMALTGMNTYEFAKKVVRDYNEELKGSNLNKETNREEGTTCI